MNLYFFYHIRNRINNNNILKISVFIIPLSLLFIYQFPFSKILDLKNISLFEYNLSLFALLKFLYCCTVLVLALFFFLKLNYQIFSKYSALFLFFIIFLYVLYWIPQGFDLSDEGYIVSKSWFMLQGLWHSSIDMTWGSTLLNGLWLSIIAKPLLLWERIGYAAIIAVMGIFSYHIIKTYFDNIFSFFTVAVAGFIIICFRPQTIDYNILPVLIILIALYLLNLSYKQNKSFYCLLSGAFFGFSVFMKFPFILFLFCPVIYFLFNDLYINKNVKLFKKNLISNSFGILLGLIIGILILFITDSLKIYANQIYNSMIKDFFLEEKDVLHKNYTKIFLFKIYFRHFIRVVFNSIVAFIGIYIVNKIIYKKPSKLISNILLGIGGAAFLIIITKLPIWFDVILGIILASVAYLIFIEKKGARYSFLIFWSLILMGISFLGSDLGMVAIFYSGGCYLGLPFGLLLIKRAESNINISRKYKFNMLFFSIFIPLIIFSMISQHQYVYRDAHRRYLVNMFHTPPLFGIHSTLKRVKVIDELYENINQTDDSSKDFLCLGHIPMLHYLLNKKYFLSNPWVEVLPPNKATNEFEEKIKSKIIPDAFIFALNSARNNTWPDTQIDFEDDNYFVQFVRNNNYFFHYSNDYFYVFTQKKRIINRIK